jgi:hypothetical protein
MHTAVTPARIARLLSRITTPAAASRASHRVYRLALKRALAKEVDAGRFYDLSDALNEHRHVLLARFLGDAKLVSEHLDNRNELARYAALPVKRAA